MFVEHTFPATDDDFPSKLKEQGGEINVTAIQESLSIAGIVITGDAHAYVVSVLNKVNSKPWQGGAVRTWLCTGADYTWLDRIKDQGEAQVSLEFQYQETGWDPDTIFIDERTGKPPKDLVEDVGYKTITYVLGVDFDTILAVTG